MTDVPPDNGAPGVSPDAPLEPPVVRRSNFTPPPPDAEPPTFDDDALAEAMAAEVATYTSPIRLPNPTPIEPPISPPISVEVPVASPPEFIAPPFIAPPFEPESIEPESIEPESIEPPASAPSLPDEQSPVAPPADASPAEDDLLRALSGASTLEAIELLENALKRISGGEQSGADLPPVAVVPSPPEAPAPPTPENPPLEGLPPLAAEVVGPPPLVPPPLPGTDALGWNLPAPVAPFEAPLDLTVTADTAPVETFRLESTASESTASEPTRSEPTPSESTAPEPITAPGEALAWLIPPAPTSPAPTSPAPTSPAVPPSDPGPQFVFPVPLSAQPPVEPESPEWWDAPPPDFQPPELVEPPADSAALDPIAPITATTMARLPLPLPTEQPNIADRAELPPPPGYEAIPVTPFGFAAVPPLLGAVPPLPSTEATESVSLDHDIDDVVDEVDRIAGTGAIPVSSSGAADILGPPSEPISTIRPNDEQPELVDRTAKTPSAFDVEVAGLEPTALDLRAGRAARLFWLWFATNSSVVSVGLGAVLLGSGMSLRQAIVATLAGVAISFLPLGLGTLAGKWSGQPTMVVSRATFGHAGNLLPALLAFVTRVFWGGTLLWLLATAVAQVLVGAGLDAGLGASVWQLVGLVVGFVIATVIAVFGYGFVAKLQLVLSIVSGLLIAGVIVITFPDVHLTAALKIPDGSWLLVISGAVFVFSVVGLAWVQSGSDVARYQRPRSSGAASMLWATFGATLPPFALVVWGALLAASNAGLAKSLRANPLTAIAALLPSWYPAPLLAAAVLGLLSSVVLATYSGGFALQALGIRVRRSMGVLITSLLVLLVAAALLFVVVDFSVVVHDVITSLAVPVAAWAGIFASEMMIRSRRFHAPSLLSPGGVYPQLRVLNFFALIVISGIGYGLITSTVAGLGWEGFLFPLLGVASHDPLATSEVGVLVALGLGVLVPIVGGIPAIRRQERMSVADGSPLPVDAGRSAAAPLVD